MSQIFEPFGWSILLIHHKGKQYFKVYASWFNDSYRFSSGFDCLGEAFREGDYIVIPQSSGAVYRLPVEGYRRHKFYAANILEQAMEQYKEKPDYEVSLLALSQTESGAVVFPLELLEGKK